MRNSKRFAILKRDTVTCCQVAGVENVVPRACHIVERGTTATSPSFSAHLMSDAGKGPLLRVISFTINVLRRIPQRVGSLADTDSMPCLSILEPWHLFHNSHISYELLVCILCQFRRSKHDQHEMLYISCTLSRADIYPWEFRLATPFVARRKNLFDREARSTLTYRSDPCRRPARIVADLWPSVDRTIERNNPGNGHDTPGNRYATLSLNLLQHRRQSTLDFTATDLSHTESASVLKQSYRSGRRQSLCSGCWTKAEISCVVLRHGIGQVNTA